jgi:protein TonB
MFDLKTLVRKFDQRLLAAPEARVGRRNRQHHLMVGALTLLLVALGLLLYKDRNFWFPETQEADELQQPAPVAAAPVSAKPVVTAAGTIPPTTKNHISKSRSRVAAAPVTPPAPPVSATAKRTVLPPLEVEVVAGDNHRTVRPGASSVRVDLQPGSRPQAAPDVAAATGAPAANVTSNAAERVQMSVGSGAIVSHPVKPGYPLLARQMKVQGSVILHALIGRDGLIQDLRVLNGPPILATAAQEAVRQWHFKPHYLGTEPVETQATITVNFTISTN